MPPARLVVLHHVEIRDALLQFLVFLRLVLRREVRHDVTAAVAEKFQRLFVLPVCPLQFDDENVQVRRQLAGREARDFMLLPHFNPP